MPVWDDILSPQHIDPGVNVSYDILTPGSIYGNDISTPLPIVHKTFFVGYDQLLNVVYCYLYIIFMKCERIG